MNIEVYTLEDAQGEPECDGWYTFDVDEARRAAREYEARLIANIYEWADSELVEDYTRLADGER